MQVVVNLRVLPPVAQCIDCRECFILPVVSTDIDRICSGSANEVVSQLREVLQSERTTGHRVMAKFEAGRYELLWCDMSTLGMGDRRYAILLL